MTSYHLIGFIVILLLAATHYVSAKLVSAKWLHHSRFLSFSSGVSVSYVFIQLFPKLTEAQIVLQNSAIGVLPFFEKHVYVFALLGLIFFYSIEQFNTHSRSLIQSQASFWVSTIAYGIFNFSVGYAISDPNDPEIQPLILFAIAMSLHLFINDHTLFENHHSAYLQLGRTLVVSMLFLGWFIGLAAEVSQAALAILIAFMAGGMIMNVFHHEMPSGYKRKSLKPFILGAVGYGSLLLFLGN